MKRETKKDIKAWRKVWKEHIKQKYQQEELITFRTE